MNKEKKGNRSYPEFPDNSNKRIFYNRYVSDFDKMIKKELGGKNDELA
jgi:hypothetical protein